VTGDVGSYYGGGLRISNWSGWTATLWRWASAFTRVLGKGPKERIVPLGKYPWKRCSNICDPAGRSFWRPATRSKNAVSEPGREKG
jgi:site-specific recombinase XerC